MIKEVKKQPKKVKEDFELEIIDLLKKGFNPIKIAAHFNISLPNLSYYLSSLKESGIIKKIGYGTWQVIPSAELKMTTHKSHLQVKNVRGHAFIWKIRPNKKFDWEELLEKENIYCEHKGLQNTPRIILGGKKIWLGQNYITIFEPDWNSYFATNPIEAKKEAVYGMIETLNLLFKITGDFKYKFTCRRHHYGFINNSEAKFFIKQNKKILIKNEKGYWFTIDHSHNIYKEAETIHEEDADIDGIGYQNLMNSHERTNFKVTPEYILNTMNGIQQNQLVFDQNMKSHLEVLEKLGRAVDELRIEIKKIAEK